jgi:hypothetical protein
MNEHPAAPAPLLRVVLPGVVSWSRPRKARGGVRYPPAYARARDAWALLVAQAVRAARWAPPPGARYHVAVGVAGGGRRDLDRVCTAALDALQAGGAVRDDCLVDALVGLRWAAVPGTGSATRVAVVAVPPEVAKTSARLRQKRAGTATRPEAPGQTEETHGW